MTKAAEFIALKRGRTPTWKGAKDFLRGRAAAGKSLRIAIQAIMAKHSGDKCVPPMFRPRFPQKNAEAGDGQMG